MAFFFELGSPFSYLAAERVERALGKVDWIPTAPLPGATAVSPDEAERHALSLRLPLVWPEREPDFPRALRAAACAAELGRSGPFAIAASRLAFCGGFDIDDPEMLAEAAAAAGLAPQECLAAARDASWDDQLQATAAGLVRRGVLELPAIRVGRTYCSGKQAVAEATAVVQVLGTASLELRGA